MRAVRSVCAVAGAGLLIALFGPLTGTARATDPIPTSSDVMELPPTLRLPLDPGTAQLVNAWRATPAGVAQVGAGGTTPPVGTVRIWPALDQVKGAVYLKEFTLRGDGKNIEIWVASGAGPDGVAGTDFRAEDCRNVIAGSTTVTHAQVKRLIQAYDRNILPKESKAFSVAPAQDGLNPEPNELTKGLTFPGDGDKVVTLVDNVRDPNFYDFPTNQTYVAGFFSRQFNELTNRNVMTIDAYDWVHRTGVKPKDQQNSDICKSRPARPHLYEGIFAHEYQHLLQYYVDPDEGSFLNEGLSDYAAGLVGYGDSTATVFQRGNESHLICFNGFGTVRTKFNPNPQACGGPQNSLTMWGDEGEGSEILADYGIAWSFLLFLRDRFGPKVLEQLHRDKARQGMASVRAALAPQLKGAKLAEVLHDFQLTMLLDKLVSGGGTLTGMDRRRVTTASLNSSINLLNPAAYLKGGVAPNGADYVPLRATGAGFLRGADLKALRFSGAQALGALPVAWSVVPKVPLLAPIAPPMIPGATPVPGSPPIEDIEVPDPGPLPLDRPALFSGNTGSSDASAVFAVTVPAGVPTLSYTSKHAMEDGFDWGYTVVSTDRGRTWKSLTNANTKPTTAPAPAGQGLTGSSVLPITQIFDLSSYAGKKVLLGFRYVSDPLVNAGGWYVSDVKVGDQLIADGTSAAPFKSFTQVRPTRIPGWAITLVGIDEVGRRAYVQRVSGRFDVRLTPDQIREFRSYPVLVAVISLDDLSERLTQYAPYTLTVNAVGQDGGEI